jgi:predicted neuraminidase
LDRKQEKPKFRKDLTRRAVFAGAGIVGIAGLAVSAARRRGFTCYILPGKYSGIEASVGEIARGDLFSDAPFAASHASTLAAAGRTLVCCWFGGRREGHPDVGIWSSVRDQDGWSPPNLAATGANPDGGAVACWNPVLWQQPEGPLHLFYKAGPTPRSWWGMAARSADGGRTWGRPARLPEGILGPIKNKPILLEDGRLLCPSSTEHDGWRVHFEWTSDFGSTWERTASIGDGKTIEIIQPAVFVHPGGRLQALCRSRQGFIAEIWSEDGGRTWSQPSLTAVRNPNSGIDGLTLADGRHLLVHNPVSRCRSPLIVSLSDDGEAWRQVSALETEPGEFSYPAVIQDSDGSVHISYTNRRTTITQVTLDPGQL